MKSAFGKTMALVAAFTIIGGAVGYGGLYYWAANPHFASELIEMGAIKPHAKLDRSLSNTDMAAILAQAQRDGALSSDEGGRERRSDFYVDGDPITLSDSDIEYLNGRYRDRLNAKRTVSAERSNQTRAVEQDLSDAGWGDDASF